MKAFLFPILAALFAAAPALAETSPEAVDGATTITTDDAVALFDDGVVFIDVRKTSDYEAGRIPGAIHLDVKTDLSEDSLAAAVAKGDKVVFYCNGHNCLRSATASGMAVGWGWSHVYYLRDGYPAWEDAGLPVE